MQTPAEGCGIAAGYGVVQAVSGDQLLSHGLPGGKTRVGRYGIWQGRGGRQRTAPGRTGHQHGQKVGSGYRALRVQPAIGNPRCGDEIILRGALHGAGIGLMTDNVGMENFTIGDLAEACSMSQSHFRRVFHELMGIGPLEHLNHTRITKACTLLRMTDESILTVGEQVGFRSMSSFNRHFAEAMGCSPSEWRRTVGAGRSTSILKYNGWLTPPRDK